MQYGSLHGWLAARYQLICAAVTFQLIISLIAIIIAILIMWINVNKLNAQQRAESVHEG